MRVFIACDLSEEIKSELSFVQNQLKKLGIEGKWVKPENFHLTLVFLGKAEENQIKETKKILVSINRIIEKPIGLKVKGISAFPFPTFARVVFAEVGGEIEILNRVVANLKQELKQKNIWFDEKPFIPHLTLARFKKKQNLSQILKKIKIKSIAFKIKEIYLYQSQLTPLGPVYSRL